jgi:hypothetical protein
MTNHWSNLQKTRLFEKKPGTTPVVRGKTFSNFTLGWDSLEENRRVFDVPTRLQIAQLGWSLRSRAGAMRHWVRQRTANYR